MVDFDTLDSGLYWLHTTGPDGPVVLLGRFDSRKQSVVQHDNADTEYFVEGPYVHKWRVYHIEPVIRPDPLPEDTP